jgi:hypothetical protein
MRTPRQCRSLAAASLAACLAAIGCGGSPSRFNPGPPGTPSGLTAAPGNGQVTLQWGAADNAQNYFVYYSTSPGVSKETGTRVANSVPNTSFTVTGLTNGVAYYFVVTAFNSNSESAVSNEATATPTELGPFAQSDLEGTWRFSVLRAGSDAGWMRGTLTVDAAGAVTVGPFLDETSNVVPPQGFFPNLLLDSTGHVRDAAGSATFTGVLSPMHRNVIVAAAASGDSASIAVLLKHDPGVTFTPSAEGVPGDIGGFGGGQNANGGGARKFAYSEITAGAAPQEWGFAEGQIGRNFPSAIQYTGQQVPLEYLVASSSNPARPTDKVTTFALTTDGLVTESINQTLLDAQPTATLPDFVLSEGYMSDDKSLIVGVGTTREGTPTRYVLRIYQIMNMSGDDMHTFAMSDLAGSYVFEKIAVGASPAAASGAIQIADTGAATFSDYADSQGAGTPADLALQLVMPEASEPPAGSHPGFYGTFTDAGDPTLHGKESYFKDVLVFTRTDPSGASSLTIALK